jgi:L-seryl-tRNA(Ser) seleniumtransferase
MELRDLPSVDELLRQAMPMAEGLPHEVLVRVIRGVIDKARVEIRAGRKPEEPLPAVERQLQQLRAPSLVPVINATGVVLHTNLGRAPLDFGHGASYSNLEYDLDSGKRGNRDVHTGGLLEALLGAPGVVVNNNAAAVFLVLHELAAGAEVIVSRGELIEIGDGFRIPDIMARSGAVLREVGTTNKTKLEDYRAAINERTALLLRVHPSNFRISGFTAKPALRELAALAHEHGLPLYEDLGSGCLVDLSAYGVSEPLAGESLEAGADLVSFSGDKLLGGPQAGIIAGRSDLVKRVRRNPMFRALRADKLAYAALEATLRRTLYRQYGEVPALRFIMTTPEEIRGRAQRVQAAAGGELVAGESVIGGGSTPEQPIPTWLLRFDGDVVEMERKLRKGKPAVIARIEDDRLLIDLRTVSAEEEEDLIAALRQARSR